MKKNRMKRECGMLLPVSALPSRYGIGCFSREAYQFVDQLKEAGQQYWQILPLGPTGYGDSPYQSFSAFAGNPYLIDLEDLIQKGLLTREECDQADFGNNPRDIDYEKLYRNRFPVLRRAFERWRERQFQDGYDEKQMEHIFSKNRYSSFSHRPYVCAISRHRLRRSSVKSSSVIRHRQFLPKVDGSLILAQPPSPR